MTHFLCPDVRALLYRRYAKLMFGKYQHILNHVIVSTLSFLRLAPKGTKEVWNHVSNIVQYPTMMELQILPLVG